MFHVYSCHIVAVINFCYYIWRACHNHIVCNGYTSWKISSWHWITKMFNYLYCPATRTDNIIKYIHGKLCAGYQLFSFLGFQSFSFMHSNVYPGAVIEPCSFRVGDYLSWYNGEQQNTIVSRRKLRWEFISECLLCIHSNWCPNILIAFNMCLHYSVW